MHRLLIGLAALLVLTLCACPTPDRNSPRTPPSASPDSSSSLLPPADANDLLDALQGRWQSEADAAQEIEIVGNQMRHFAQQRLSHESELEVDASCRSAACAPDSTAALEGWCVLAKSQHDVQCFVVVKCDSAALHYRPVGAGQALQRYIRKIGGGTK